MQSKPMFSNNSIDLIRTVAIVLVIISHASAFPYNTPEKVSLQVITNWWSIGSIGLNAVPLFVMVTGALLLTPQKANEPMRVFFKKRFSRIALPMIFWSIFYFAWAIYFDKEVLSTTEILQKIFFSGTFYHLWFMYLLIGLYFLTPVLRLAVKNIDRKKIVTLIVFCFALSISSQFIGKIWMFAPVGWVGFYLSGSFLKEVKFNRRWLLLAFAILGIIIAIIGAYIVGANLITEYIVSMNKMLSFNLIISSVALFLLLIAIPPNRINSWDDHVNLTVHWISQNTLPIYLVHLAILETLEWGLVSCNVSLNSINPVLFVLPLAFATFLFSVAIIFPLKKVPYIKNIIG